MIETERLLLRPFTAEDAADVYDYLKAPEVNCFAGMRLESEKAAEAEIARRLAEDHGGCYFAVVLKETGKVIGEMFAYPERTSPTDESMDTYSPCWMLNRAYQGKGYALEAACAFFEYLFTEKGARRLYAYTEDYNLSSQHLCEKLGMRREGLFMEFVCFVKDADGNPIYENTMQYAILKKEWEKQRAEGRTV